MPPLQLIVEPKNIEVEAGSTIELLCQVTCDCQGLVLRWSRTEQDLPPQAQVGRSMYPDKIIDIEILTINSHG